MWYNNIKNIIILYIIIMFSWLSNKLGLSNKNKPPSPPKPKLLTIFNSITYLSPDGEKTSPINLEPKPKKRKKNPKSWNKNARTDNQKSITRAANLLRNDVQTTLGLHTPKPLTTLVSTKTDSKSTNQTKSILKRKRTDGGNKTKKNKKTCTIETNFVY
uniref:Uncharacterized protein n=1 Tax=viral metagenome TaxID=1070528 RepID=A0A6C0J420_9ZZZZ